VTPSQIIEEATRKAHTGRRSAVSDLADRIDPRKWEVWPDNFNSVVPVHRADLLAASDALRSSQERERRLVEALEECRRTFDVMKGETTAKQSTLRHWVQAKIDMVTAALSQKEPTS
jgi:hypothetical protein